MRTWAHPKMIAGLLALAGVLVPLLFRTPQQANHVVFRGRVTDDRTGAPLRKSKISISAHPVAGTTYTDDEGNFVLTLRRHQLETDVRLRVTAAGYEPYDRTIDPSGTHPEDIRLPIASPLATPRRTASGEKPAAISVAPPGPAPPSVLGCDIRPYFRPDVLTRGGTAIFIVDETGFLDASLTARAAEVLKATASLFVADFGSTAAFKAARDGRACGLDSLAPMARVILGVRRVKTELQDIAGSSVSREVLELDLWAFAPSSRTTTQVTMSGVGVGFDPQRASEKATSGVLDRLINFASSAPSLRNLVARHPPD